MTRSESCRGRKTSALLVPSCADGLHRWGRLAPRPAVSCYVGGPGVADELIVQRFALLIRLVQETRGGRCSCLAMSLVGGVRVSARALCGWGGCIPLCCGDRRIDAPRTAVVALAATFPHELLEVLADAVNAYAKTPRQLVDPHRAPLLEEANDSISALVAKQSQTLPSVRVD